MPTLKAKVGGNWVDLIAGTDEVWVGSAAPTDPATELWVYPDGYSVNDPNIARWNSAWGSVGASSTKVLQNIGTSFVTLNNIAVTFTAVAGRKYVVTAMFDYTQKVSAGSVYFQIYDETAGVSLLDALQWAPIASGLYTQTLVLSDWRPTAGITRTVRLRAHTNSSANTDYNAYGGSHLLVEDVGPVSQAVAPPAQPPSTWTTPTLLNGWTNFGAPWATFAYRLVGDKVELRGLANHPAGSIGTRVSSVMFMLPVGYRPPTNSNLIFLIMAGGTSGWGGATGRIDILSTGEVQVMDPEGVSRPDMLVSLAGLSFSVTA